MLGAYLAYRFLFVRRAGFNANREHDSSGASAEKKATVMLFYTNWCPHCKTAKPVWQTIKDKYEGTQVNGYTIHFVEYDCTEEDHPDVVAIQDKYKIEGYPTIKMLKDNQVIEYDAKLSEDTMDTFLQTTL